MILTSAQLNRAVLARQGLLERRELSLPAALDAMAGLQAQYAPSMYIGLWSRVAGLERAAVTRALEDRSVIQATLMRFTIHLVSADDFWPLALAIRAARRAQWLRTGPPLDAEAARLREAFRDGPLRRKELEAVVGKEALPGIGAWVDMVRVPPQGTWEKRRADRFGLAGDWLPPRPVEDPLGHLVARYLTGFGPAAKADIANWAGLPARDVEPALAGLVTYEAEDGTTLHDLPGLPLPDPDTPAPVRFLPTWDAALLAHARRARILPEEHRDKVFHTRMPQSIGTFLVDGRVAGTWKPDGTLTPFAGLSDRARTQVDKEFAALTAFMA